MPKSGGGGIASLPQFRRPYELIAMQGSQRESERKQDIGIKNKDFIGPDRVDFKFFWSK